MEKVKDKAGSCQKLPGHLRGTPMELRTEGLYNTIEIESIPDGDYIDHCLLESSIVDHSKCTMQCPVCCFRGAL